jgi:LysM repeat protein
MAFLSVRAFAQTLSLNDGSIVQSSPNRIGLNIGAIDYWDNGQILKNLIGSTNPGLEPLQNRQIWALTSAGTATTFTIPDTYDGVPANYWAGGTFTVLESQSGGAELGCSGTIASNTGPNYPLTGQASYTAPVITVSTACNAPFSVGDIVAMSKLTYPTPESWWESGALGGMAGTVTGGAQLLSDTTDLCATCGTQSLNMNATTSGSSATATWYFDSENTDNIFVLMNGTYQLSFWAKSASGTPVLTASASRGSQGGFNCGSYTPTLSTTWTQYTWTCTASESASGTTPGIAQVSFTATKGSVYLDNVSFEKTGTNPSNTTALRDEVIEALQNYYGPSIGNNPGMFRYWVNQNGETMSNWTAPDYAHGPTSGGAGYFVGPGGAGVVSLSLEDYLVICQQLNAQPYLEVPVTFSTAEAANLIEFLASPSSTTYGGRRAALGQDDPWTSVFSQIHLSYCNECWNGQSFAGQSLSDRSSAPNSEYYYDYSVRARDIFAAMRADSYYSAPSFDLVMNAQTATNYSMDTAIQRAHPDSIEIEGYTYGSVSSFSTDAALWQPAMVEPYEKVTNPSDVYNFYQSVHDYQSQTTCGASGTAACNVNMYEWGQGTIAGSIDQTHMDYINAGAGEGVVMALQPLLNLQYYGIRPQSFFSLTEYKNGASNGLTNKLWGNVVDMGGATNNVRPEFLGVSLVNQSIIGSMYSCPIANNPTYNFAGSPNGISALPALNNVPYLYAFCFENGTKRSLVLINTDLSGSHTVSFAGTNPPIGTVTQRQYAPAALDDMNEAPTGTATNQTQATVAIDTSTLSSPSSISLPPFSVTALDYTAEGLTAAAAPAFSPAAGSYTTAQSVTITDATAGATIYYTTNGTTPTSSSTKYTGAITVSATETLEAIAVETGYSNSPVATAAYTIAAALPAPTFSVAAGSYSTAQTVTITDATAGATIYYTTNGTTPTTSSAKYTGAIMVSATETLEAIAAETGYSNSPVATAAYTIAAALSAPVFSPAPTTYTSPQSVTISDATAGATIYYTTNGTTPTTSSTQYMGAIWQSSTQTLKAIAVETGYANSAVTTAAYTIAPVLPAPTFSPTGGGASWATFTTPPSVTISDSQAGTTFYYTTNGTTPTTSSTLYTGPITVSQTETIQAIAVETGYTNSAMSAMLYTIAPMLPAPTLSLASGSYTTAQTVTISDATAGATIYYTTNGTTPTSSSTKYTGAISVSATETLEAIAVEAGSCNSPAATATYTINPVLPSPTFSVAAGTYTTSQTVTISDATAGTAIHYTTNGATPTASSTVYNGPITVSATETLEAIAVETGYTNSAVAAASYTIVPVLPTPTFSLAAGTYTTAQTVTISDATAGTTIYYTTNGATPTTSSTVYNGPITVSATETLEAIAVETGYTNSSVATAAYTIAPVLPTPTYSLAVGTYTTSQSVTITDATSGATIYYTTNGVTPTTSSTKYTGAITVSATETLEAIAVETGYTNSPATTATYTIAPVLPAPTFSLAAGSYTTAQTVTISDATAGTTIYYTTNGTAPTTSSTVYRAPITVSTTETLEAIAVETGYTNSSAATVSYTIVIADPTYINYPSSGFTAASLSLNNGPTVTGGVLQLTDGGTGEARSAWFTSKVPVSAFTTDFTFKILDGAADGFTFTIQNDPKCIWALGYGGSGLGYQSIQNSVAVKFDIYNDAGEGTDSIGVYTDGAAPTVAATDLTSSKIILSSGDLIHAHLVYNGTTLAVTLTDTTSGATVTNQYTVNIPTVVGGTTAYAGFTGSTGGFTAVQQVTSWTYSAQ